MKLKYILLFLIMLIIPSYVYASEVDYDITNYYIKANILENGNMEVNELIVMDGTFNGYERELRYKNSNLDKYEDLNFEHSQIYNAKGIIDYSFYAKYVNKVSFDTFDEEFTKLEKVSSQSSARKGDVYVSHVYDGLNARMYYRANNQKVAFLVKYTVDSAVVIHNDVAELYWTFMGDNFTDDIEDLKIMIYLPYEDDSDNFRVWAHGDLTGEIYMKNYECVEATMPKLYAKNPVDVRMTFSKELISDDSNLNHTDVDAFNKILKVEQKRADEANAKRKKAKILINILLIISGLFFVYQMFSILYIYKKYDKEYESDFDNDYYREFIDDYNVEVVDYIMNKNISPNAMSASIMNLIYKKNIKSEKIQESKKDEYAFTLLNRDNINEAEENLINFLFDKVGNGQAFTTKQLQDYAKSTKTYSSFNNSYTGWKNKVLTAGRNLKIYESHFKVILYAVLMVVIALILNGISMNLGLYVGFINLFLSIGILVYCIAFNKRTVYGNEQYVRWKAFKKFLNDFGDFESKELPEIALWERYMVYATVFGIADKVAKTMNVKIKEMQENGTYVSDYDPYFYHCNLAHTVNSSVSRAVSNAQSTAASVAASSYSSGSGHGGGFSSGGGFGGGGGGGHGF